MLRVLFHRESPVRSVHFCLLLAVLTTGGIPPTAYGQASVHVVRAPPSVVLMETLDTLQADLAPPPLGEGRAHADVLPVSRGRASPLAGGVGTGQSQPDECLPIGRTVRASAGGVALGSALGLMLLLGAEEADVDDDRYPDWYRSGPDAAGGLFAASLLAFAAGGPIGAVEGAGIDRRKTDGYMVAGVGEFVIGGMGFGIGGLIHDSPTARLTGLALGASVGAAAGALLVASKERRSAFTYRSGSWHVSSPAVEINPGFGPGATPRVSVSLLTARW